MSATMSDAGSTAAPLRLLVTGRAGQVALALAERAAAAGHVVLPGGFRLNAAPRTAARFLL
ncbi:MAG: hypothetical protein ACOVOI_18505, partial [Hyphomicrobiales bacterium]